MKHIHVVTCPRNCRAAVPRHYKAPNGGQRKQRLGGAHGGGQGLSAAEVAYQIQLQGGVCMICQRVPTDRFEIDHDHDRAVAEGHPHDPTKGCKGCFRGMICRQCNSGLGFFRDDIESLRRAVRYLELARER